MKSFIRLIAQIIFLLIINGNIHAQGIWTQKADFAAGAITEERAFGIGTKGYFGAATPDLWEYDPQTDSWTQKASFIGATRSSAAGFSIGTKGYFGTGGNFNDFYEYDQTANAWTQKTNFGGSAREGAVGCAINGKGYIGLGGNYLADWWEYDPALNAWTQKANLGGPGRYHAGAFAIGNKGYVSCGFNGSFFNDLWEYDPALNTWTQMANMPGTTRDRPVGFAIGTKGYIVTGWTGSAALNDAWEWDQASNSWTQITSLPGAARYNACGFTAGTKLYIGTGYANGSVADFWEYGPNCSIQTDALGASCYGTCDGSASVIFPDSAAAVSYVWSTGATTQALTGLCGGTYNVTVTDTAGCTTSIQLVVTEPTQITATTTSVLPTCFGDADGTLCAVPSGGTSPYTYLWFDGQTTPCNQPLAGGTYAVTITDSVGCSGMSLLTLTQPGLILINFSHTDATCPTCNNGNASASISGGTGPFSYSWSNGSTSAYVPNLLPGTYTCCVTDSHSCSVCDSVIVSYITLVENHNAVSNFSIAPNPFADYFIIKWNGNKDLLRNAEISLSDISGRAYKAIAAFESGQIRVMTGDLGSGVYFLRIISEGKFSYIKIIK